LTTFFDDFGHSNNMCTRKNYQSANFWTDFPKSNPKVQSQMEKDIHVLLPSPNVGFVYRNGRNLEVNIRIETDPITHCDTWKKLKTSVRFADRPERDLDRFFQVCLEHSGKPRIREVLSFVQPLTADRFSELCIHVVKDNLEMLSQKRQEICQKVELCKLTLLHHNEVLARKVTVSVQLVQLPGISKIMAEQLNSIVAGIIDPIKSTHQDFFIGGYPEFLIKWYTMRIVPVHVEGPSVFKSSPEADDKEKNKLFANNPSVCIIQ